MSSPGADPTNLPIELDGRTVEAAWWGASPEEAPTLVLLHEGLGSVALWREFPQRLAQATGLGVLAYSRFGYGRSASIALPRPLAYMHDEAAQTLPACLMPLASGRRFCSGIPTVRPLPPSTPAATEMFGCAG